MNANTVGALILIPLGTILMLCGLLVYNGRFRHYRTGLNIVLSGEPALATTYLGAAFILMPLTQFAMDGGINALVTMFLILLMFIAGILGVLGSFWMPPFLQPQWIRDEKKAARRRRMEEAARRTSGGGMSSQADGRSNF
ncbi:MULTISPECIES: hypothetical protein [unclassified Arthrobacter]|uniref:hypothetical protein n=1 Tax=unclassified Arthrobacter TaxID=235627 RepID=UPI0021047552|nr:MULTISPECIES: hypothetical protein [unclassified Arthrobacter]MCQ1945550.1 hypothetical protein [Arthrobacter sp. zg-Y1116]MCQ1985492.1 hypothetical protein [Arthrobacter sp. zg-Y844]